MKKIITSKDVEFFLNNKTTPQQTMEIIEAMVLDPSLQETVITNERLDYEMEQLKEYGNFIPASKMAADDGNNLCDLQCEAFLLKKHGREFPEEDKLAEEAKINYWLGNLGTPLYNVGRLLEKYGLVVIRQYNANMETLGQLLGGYDAIAVVNGDTLTNKGDNLFDDNNPNHAVVVEKIDRDNNKVTLFNPATHNEHDTYDLVTFSKAWDESKNYLVIVREPNFPNEFIPQPIDVSDVNIPESLSDLTDFIAENAHNVWAEKKIKDNPGIKYAPVDENGNEIPGHNHYLLPYSLLPDIDKQPDIDMAMKTIKLLKRLGTRLLDISKMHRCSKCNGLIEMNFIYCPNCGRKLSWEDFKM